MSDFILWLVCWIVIGLVADRTHADRIFNVTEDALEGAWDVIDRATRLGLRASEHTVHTEDEYVLRAFRVHGTNVGNSPPVLLMHGLLQSSAGWLDAGGASLAYLLTGAGRDLWLGNARGSYYSRRHAWLRPDTDASFWRFTANEIGCQDLPALIDYILETTGTDKLDYIGLSQGGGVFFIMCSERPEYRAKVNLMVALAPATRMLHTTSVPFRLINEYYQYNEEILDKKGIWEALPFRGLFQSGLKSFCGFSEAALEVCQAMVSVLFGPNPGSTSRSIFLAATESTPAGTSVHNMAWFGQLVKSDQFRKFDYGPEQNLICYGSETAPAYNLSAATVPAVVVYGRNDAVVDVRDIKWLIQQLPNVKKVIKIKDPLWNHMDFVVSKNIPKFLFPKIEEILS